MAVPQNSPATSGYECGLFGRSGDEPLAMNLPGDGYALTTFVALFAIMGVLSLPPVFLAVTGTMDAAHRRKTELQAALAIAVVMVVSYFIGGWILSIFKIDIEAFRIAGWQKSEPNLRTQSECHSPSPYARLTPPRDL